MSWTKDPCRVWEELVAGRLVVLGHRVDATHASLCVQARPLSGGVLRVAGAEVLERVLVGCSQKVVAMDLGVSPSCACSRASYALRAFGLTGSLRRAPLALAIIAACRERADSALTIPRGYAAIPRGESCVELTMLRPESSLRAGLGVAEFEILSAVVEGRSLKQVAALRQRSKCTIANQLRSIADKLHVSGRFRFVALAVRLSGTRVANRLAS